MQTALYLRKMAACMPSMGSNSTVILHQPRLITLSRRAPPARTMDGSTFQALPRRSGLLSSSRTGRLRRLSTVASRKSLSLWPLSNLTGVLGRLRYLQLTTAHGKTLAREGYQLYSMFEVSTSRRTALSSRSNVGPPYAVNSSCMRYLYTRRSLSMQIYIKGKLNLTTTRTIS